MNCDFFSFIIIIVIVVNYDVFVPHFVVVGVDVIISSCLNVIIAIIVVVT